MTEKELIELIESSPVKSLKFDGYEFEIEFDSISVTVGHHTEYDYSVWEFESSIEKEEKRKQHEEWQAEQRAINSRAKDILAKLDNKEANELLMLIRKCT